MPEPNESPSTTSRRRFFKILIGLFASINAAALGIPFIRTLLSSPYRPKGSDWTRLADLASLTENEPAEIRFETTTDEAYLHKTVLNSAWIVRHPDSSVTAFSPVCTHLGCHYTWNPGTSHFECPCHASVFGIDGKVISGPAPRPLDLLSARVEDDVVFIKWEQFRAGSPKKISI